MGGQVHLLLSKINSLIIKYKVFLKKWVYTRKVDNLTFINVLRRKFHSLLFTRWNSLVARYSLQNSLVIRCRSYSLQKITRYSLLVAKFAHYSLRKLLVAEVARCKNHSLLVAEVTHCKIRSLLVAKIHSPLVMKKIWELMFI